MKTLKELQDLGVRDLSVSNGQAVAVNPYVKNNPCECEGHEVCDTCTIGELLYYLPPLPCAKSVKEGTYQIGEFSEVLQYRKKGGEWIDWNAFPNCLIHDGTTDARTVLVLSEPVAENALKFVLTKDSAGGKVYFKCKDKTGHTNTSSKDDAMIFNSKDDAIEYNHKSLYGDYGAEPLSETEDEDEINLARIDFVNCNTDYDYTICEWVDVSNQILVAEYAISDFDPLDYKDEPKPEIKITPVVMKVSEFEDLRKKWFEDI